MKQTRINSGSIIKFIANIVFVVNFIGAIVTAFIMFFSNKGQFWWVGLIILLAGFVIAFVPYIFIYAFGELVENSGIIKYELIKANNQNVQKEQSLETGEQKTEEIKTNGSKIEIKPVKNTSDKKPKVPTKIGEKTATFLTTYFGRDSKDETVRIESGTVVKISHYNDSDKTYDVEYIEGKTKKLVNGVQPHYLKIDD